MIPFLAEPAVRLCIAASGAFFMTGLLTGIWKYLHMARSPTATAPVYVDLTHRTALLYSFASLLVAVFAGLSAWSDTVNLVASALLLFYFAFAVIGYLVHGILRDTDNQFLRPHRVGPIALPRHAVAVAMWALIAAEVGGFAVLLAGTLRAL